MNYEDETWPAVRLLRTMLRCSDYMPFALYRDVADAYDLDCASTCGAVARELLNQRVGRQVAPA